VAPLLLPQAEREVQHAEVQVAVHQVRAQRQDTLPEQNLRRHPQESHLLLQVWQLVLDHQSQERQFLSQRLVHVDLRTELRHQVEYLSCVLQAQSFLVCQF